MREIEKRERDELLDKIFNHLEITGNSSIHQPEYKLDFLNLCREAYSLGYCRNTKRSPITGSVIWEESKSRAFCDPDKDTSKARNVRFLYDVWDEWCLAMAFGRPPRRYRGKSNCSRIV